MDLSLSSCFRMRSRLVLMAVSCLFIVVACNKKKPNSVDTAFAKYIEAYSSGVVSKTTAIRIRLTEGSSTTHTLNETLKESLFSFSPSVRGKSYWVDARTVEFKPDEYLRPDQLYEVEFALGKAMEVPEAFRNFHFTIQTIKPSFQVREEGLRVEGNSKSRMLLDGEIETADIESSQKVTEILTAFVGNDALPIAWEHNEANRLHHFKVQDIKRGSATSTLKLMWNGTALGIKLKDEKSIEVPAVGDYKVLGVRAIQDAENYILVQFSDAIAVNQELNGLIAVSNKSALSYSINGSEVKVYVPDELDGDYAVSVNEGIQNLWNARLPTSFSANVFFENRLPSVRISGRGVILPHSGKLVLPFDAINLNAVDLSIIRIYENNIPQFLQVNGLEGDEDLRRVGSAIVQKTIRLDDDKTLDLHKRRRFSLDIDKFLQSEPGAIYRVTIGFRPEYSLYTCHESAKDKKDEDEENDYAAYYADNENVVDEEDSFWRLYNAYYPYGFNWEQRNNPCSRSYYNKDRWASRNIIASNIGLTTKRGNDNSMLVAATDILTTLPLADIELDLLDYQQQVILKTKTDKEGLAVFDLKKKPYLLIAKKGDERGYLKLDDGSALPLSRFDVAGAEVKNGIKGFIFGERGVWRPGDSMYINFIVEEKGANLPKDHPVEFSLFTPQGQLYKKIIETHADNGFYLFKTATAAASPTGNWLAKVKLGGAQFEKRLKVETIMPNRLKINLDFGADAVLGKEAPSTGTLSSKWLFGAPAKNLKARIDASLYARKTVFKKFPQYLFDNPTSKYATESKTIFDGSLNEEGVAQVNAKFDIDKTAPGMLSASLLVKVFEPGGAFSVDNTVVPYSPYAGYVGIRVPDGPKPWGFLLTNKTYEMPIVNVDAKGNPQQGSQEVQVELYRVQWRWWWDNTSEEFSNFTQDNYNKILRKETVRLSNGVGKWNLSAPGGEWGRYLVLVRDLKSGHVTGSVVYFDDPWWQTRNAGTDPSAAAMLSFTADKERYNVGEEVKLNIPSSKGGRALISIESGTRVLKTSWVETQQGQTIFTFKAESGMAPNVFVNVSLLQPHAQTTNDLPIRMYGVIPILVEDRNTFLKPVISMPDVIKPEQSSVISISESSGKEMTYCLAIVDEGLLDLTHFKTPDPHEAFYAKEALGVKSWDLFDNVIGAWGSELDRILTIGGDEDAGGQARQKSASRFKPVVKYMGPFHLNKGEKQTRRFQLPPYIGSVRAMVVAANEGAYGFAEKSIQVKKPLMLLATMPRVLGPSENIKLPVTVFAMDNNIRSVNISLQGNPFLEPVGGNTRTVSFTAPGEQMAYFEVKVKPIEGIGRVKLMAGSGAEKAEYEVEIDIRNPNPPVTNIGESTIAAGQQWSGSATPIGLPERGKAVLEISSIPAMNLEKRLNYLIGYPHGCIEQTVSSVFPQLVLNNLVELNDRRKAEIDRNVRAGIEKMKNFQCPDGGFSYWPGEPESDEWGTNYAGHFLLTAQEKGWIVSTELLSEWKNYERSKANAWVPSTADFYGGDLTQAYRLYLLALSRAPELGAMNRLREFKYLSPEAKWRLAAAYKLAGQNNAALNLANGLPADFGKRKSPGITFGSELRDQAMVLETLTLLGKRKEAGDLVRTIAAKLSQDDWYSTQTTAYSLIAIAAYCGANPNGQKIMAGLSVNGNKLVLNTAAYVSQTPVNLNTKDRNITVKNRGSNTLYIRLIVQGQPLTGEGIKISNNPDLLQMNVSYLTLNGKAVDINKLVQGTDFVAKVVLRNPGKRGRYENMALTQVFPGGWEILNTRMLNNEGSFKSSASTYQDIRDDRVYTYFDMKEGETLTFYTMLNAAYLGKYFMPGLYCEEMYDNTISAGIGGGWVEVVEK